MKSTLLTILSTLTLFVVGGVDGAGQDTWIKKYGGSQIDQGTSLATAPNGDILLAGFTESNDGDFPMMNKGGSSRDIFVMKLDKTGKILWRKVIGGWTTDVAKSIMHSPDGGVIVVGSTNSKDGDFYPMNKGDYDAFVMKLDEDGSVVWTKLIGGTRADYGESVTATSDDGILISGAMYSNDGDFTGMNKGGRDVFVIKLDWDGGIVWKKVIGGFQDDVGGCVTTTPRGDILVTGGTSSDDGDFGRLSRGSDDIFVAKLDNAGTLRWTKTFGGKAWEFPDMITATTDDGILIAGSTESNDGDFMGLNKGDRDVFVMKLDTDGNTLWKKLFGGTLTDLGTALTTTADNGVLLTGSIGSIDGDFEGMCYGWWDVLVVKLRQDGSVLWKRHFGGNARDVGTCITTTKDGDILVSGLSSSATDDFKGLSKGFDDIFCLKLSSNGILFPSTSVNEPTSPSSPLFVSPNPLSTSSTITYNLQAPSMVRIELVNTMGQVVDILHDGYSDSGTFHHTLNVTALTTGMYVLRMFSDAGIHTSMVSAVR